MLMDVQKALSSPYCSVSKDNICESRLSYRHMKLASFGFRLYERNKTYAWLPFE